MNEVAIIKSKNQYLIAKANNRYEYFRVSLPHQME